MGKLFLRTFGCQMNQYDSDRISDVLRDAEGLDRTANPEEADVIVFNTCSVREKAQEKLFADLGRVKHLKRAKPGLMIAVGGCVASQEGPAVIERAPYVDVVFGPQTLHRLPELLERRRSTGRPQVDISFPEIAHLAAQGVKEVTLLGQNVNAWRGTIDGAQADFAELLYYIRELPLERI